MKRDGDDDMIRSAYSELPTAPPSRQFQRRVLSLAATTSQRHASSALSIPLEQLLMMRAGGATLGFALGLALFAMMLQLTSPMAVSSGASVGDPRGANLLLASLAVDPIESLADEWARRENSP